MTGFCQGLLQAAILNAEKTLGTKLVFTSIDVGTIMPFLMFIHIASKTEARRAPKSFQSDVFATKSISEIYLDNVH